MLLRNILGNNVGCMKPIIGKLFSILIITSLVFVSCTSTRDVLGSNKGISLFDMYNGYRGRVYLGISGPYESDAQATEVAVMNCAKNIALSEELRVRSDVDLKSITKYNYEKFKIYSKSIYDVYKLKTILNNMEILTIERGEYDTGVYVLAYYDGSESKGFDFPVSYDANGRPSWIENPPQMLGYITGVGVAKGYYYLQDSIEAAAFEGAIDLIFQQDRALVVSSEMINILDSAIRQEMTRDVYQINYGMLDGFTVLAYWHDQQERTYFALVAAKE